MNNELDKKDNEKDNKMSQISTRTSNPIDYFANNHSFVFIYKKTEKLGTALYMVTNLFSDSEPMKWTLRTKISSLLSFVLSFKEIFSLKEEEFSNEVKTKVLEIVSLLEIASMSGLVSPMNFSILKDEFMNLLNSLNHIKKRNTYGEGDLKKNFFNLDNEKRDPIKDFKGSLKDNTDLIYNSVGKKTNRQNMIIELLKKGGDLSIKDISEFVKNCSEKTIQRELNHLIKIGMVLKNGERRWSKYSLK